MVQAAVWTIQLAVHHHDQSLNAKLIVGDRDNSTDGWPREFCFGMNAELVCNMMCDYVRINRRHKIEKSSALFVRQIPSSVGQQFNSVFNKK